MIDDKEALEKGRILKKFKDEQYAKLGGPKGPYFGYAGALAGYLGSG